MYPFRIAFLLILTTFLSGNLLAQTYSVDGIEAFSYHGIKPILNGREVVGYVLFYKLDKADSKNDNYRLDLLDENLTKVNSVKVNLPRNAILFNTVYNGEALGVMFFNKVKENYIFRSFDKTLKEIGASSIEKPNNWERMTIEHASLDESATLFGLRAVPGKGFVRTGFGKSKDQFQVVFYTNDFKQKWHYQTPEDAEGYESFMILDLNDRYLAGMTTRKKHLMSHNYDYALTVFDLESGQKLLDTPVEDDKEQLSISNAILMPDTSRIVVQGEYYKPDDKPGVDKSLGFYLKTFDLNTGESISKTQFSWAKDINKLFDAKGKESIENRYLNFPHTMINAANGHNYIVFEQFKKVADGLGIAVVALGGSASLVKVKVGNLWVLELDAESKPVSIKYYEKDPSDVLLPPGAGLISPGLMGYYAKLVGGFDFQFVQQSNDKSTFNVSYISSDHPKGEKAKRIAGNIFLAKDGSLNFDKVDITRAKKTNQFLYQAQSGNVMVAEFNSKEETLELRLVKLNY